MTKPSGERPLEYQLQETFKGITFTYNGPEQDPIALGNDRVGDFEDTFLWRHGDPNTDKYLVMDVNVHSDKIVLLAYWTKNKWWKYRIFPADQEYQRREKGGGGWEPRESVTMLRVWTDQQHAVVEVQKANMGYDARLELNPNCQLIYNPATRRYTQRC